MKLRAINRARFLRCHEQLARLVLFLIDTFGSHSSNLPLIFWRFAVCPSFLVVGGRDGSWKKKTSTKNKS